MDTITLNSPEDMYDLGKRLASELRGGEVLALYGGMGSGKTHFVKGLARGLGYTGEVTSPTFTLIHEYDGGRLPLYHLDLYRLEEPDAVSRLGVEDYFGGPGVTAVEWADRAEPLLPGLTWRLHFSSPSESRRTVTSIPARH
ncbi:tRNA (adenosine(37)-N6)-threonylcarbamoyltransferase complex ATPase subunit type 1 TsaE [Verrucomicrobia bacterium LW23]|nr:tRNA (adenosine(37)-N6)-threonylcarbamoyltransferase complex ATPase subunit type 1 TsaE [Verrucomicrobia bacterium LW23]